MATLSLLCRIHQKRIAFRYFIHEIHLRYQLGLIYPCFLCVLKAAWRGLTVTVSLYCVNSFWYIASLRLISPNTGKCGPEKTPYLDTFHAVLLIPFVAGDKRYNLRRTVTSEKNSLSSTKHCFLYLIIPGMVFSSYSINLIPNNCTYVDSW